MSHSPYTDNSIKGTIAGLWEWFSFSNYLNEDTFTARLRSYKTVSFIFFLFSSFLNFMSDLYYSFAITSVFTIFIVIVGYLIDWGKVKSAYAMLLFIFISALLLLCYFEGLDAGAYFFFFPCIISFAFLSDFIDKKSTIITYVISFIALITCIFISPEHSEYQEMTPALYTMNFRFNVITSFGFLAWMSFAIARENQRRLMTLRNKEIYLNTIFNTALHGELIVDMENGLVTNHNSHSSLLLGAGEAQPITGSEACSYFQELSLEGGDELYKQMCDPTKPWEGELTCIRKDDTLFPAHVRIATFRYDGKDYKKLTITDITDRKLILNELHDAKSKAEESAAVKTQFLSNMSHELRTPLNGIIGATNLILQDKTLPAQLEQLNILKYSSEHMLSLINDILDLSKLDAQKVKLEMLAIDIPGFINTVTAPFINQLRDKGLGFEIKTDPQIKYSVTGDPTRLNQILTNLLSNAIKFTNTGTITVEIRELSATTENSRLEFSVTDTGIGISEEKKKKIFEQFIQADEKTTRKYGGTGLGLTISQRLVRLMDSELRVESKHNRGSRFYFEVNMPVHKSRNNKLFLNNKSPQDAVVLKGLKVLIAEDNPINMMIASRFLDKWGIKYSKAVNGLEAVSLCSANEFDVILMDLEMPEMDGYGALNEIRKVNERIPAIAFTAAVFENMKEKLTASGFNDYIQKPFQPEDLHARLVKFTRDFPKAV